MRSTSYYHYYLSKHKEKENENNISSSFTSTSTNASNSRSESKIAGGKKTNSLLDNTTTGRSNGFMESDDTSLNKISSVVQEGEGCTNNKNKKINFRQISISAETNLHEKIQSSKLFENEAQIITKVPKFHRAEIHEGSELGRGGYCVVNEITQISLLEHLSEELEPVENADDGFIHNRSFMGKHYVRNSMIKSNRQSMECRYAIKKIKESCFDDATMLLDALMDIAIEAKFLSCLPPHPSIIKMRAMSNTSQYNSKGFFLVLDRLYETLTQRLDGWKTEKLKTEGFLTKLFSLSGKQAKDFWRDRCSFACDLADAVKFLHSHNVMHRDIKPDNIGFDIRGDIKLFDFGLAKEFKPDHRDSNGCFHLTARTGSLRYMDPHVALGLPYNELCDVYSFSILLWQMLQLETPYDELSMKTFMKRVVREGLRPTVNWHWPEHLQKLMLSGWNRFYASRPSMKKVHEALQQEIGTGEDSIKDVRFVMKRNKSKLSARALSGLNRNNSAKTGFSK